LISYQANAAVGPHLSYYQLPQVKQLDTSTISSSSGSSIADSNRTAASSS
jgi:hypothetical protein